MADCPGQLNMKNFETISIFHFWALARVCYVWTLVFFRWYEWDMSKNKYRSVQELRSSSKLFRYFWFNLFQAVNFDCWEGLVWFGLDTQFEQTENNFFLVCFDWVWIGLLTPQTHKQINNYLILIGFICEFVFGYSTNKQTN